MLFPQRLSLNVFFDVIYKRPKHVSLLIQYELVHPQPPNCVVPVHAPLGLSFYLWLKSKRIILVPLHLSVNRFNVVVDWWLRVKLHVLVRRVLFVIRQEKEFDFLL